MPVGAFGGKREVMEVVAPLGGVYQAGTLSGNPIAMQAGLTTLELIDEPGFYELLEQQSGKLVDGLQLLADKAGIPFTTNRVGSMFGFFFTDATPVTGFSQVMNADSKMFNLFFHAMLRQGINLAPSPFESGFVSAAHGDKEIKDTLDAAQIAFTELDT
jgi:glutamate-1-semialdehyde 2,1-aminomutase